MFKSKLTTMVFLALCAAFLSQPALAQTQAVAPQPQVASAPDVQLLRAILEELRLQRAALQRTYVNAHRAQVLTERLARQQARVDSLGEEIAQLKSLIEQSQNASHDEDDLKDLLATINETPDPQQRAALVQSYNSLKRSLERQREYTRQEVERNRERQQQLEAALRMEQAKLAELQDQFDALDREFDRQLGETRKVR